MTELLQQLIYIALIVVLPTTANYLINLLKAKTEQTEYAEIAEIVADAVEETNQVFVDELKKAGAFDLEAQAAALERSVSTVISRLSDTLKRYIEKTGTEITDYITTAIESYIKTHK